MAEVEQLEPDDIVVKIDMTITDENLSSEVEDHDIAAEESEEILTPMDYAETIAEIDYGCMFKSKAGVSGEIPEQDSFPFFSSAKKWTCLMWGGPPTQWRLLSFEGERPEDIYDTEASFKATYIMLSSITEVFIELYPSSSFRIYQDQVVTRCTPQPESRDHAESWVNAIYAAMQVQSLEETEEILQLRNHFIDEQEAAEDEEEVENAVDAEAIVDPEQDPSLPKADDEPPVPKDGCCILS